MVFMENVYDKLVEFAMTFGIKIIGAIIILIVGRIVAGIEIPFPQHSIHMVQE